MPADTSTYTPTLLDGCEGAGILLLSLLCQAVNTSEEQNRLQDMLLYPNQQLLPAFLLIPLYVTAT